VAELTPSGSIRTLFVYGTRPHVPDLMLRDGETYRLLTDARGSVRLVVNVTTGEIAQRLTYDPWGRVLEDTTPAFQPFAFAGGLYDPLTGLVRFGARDYDPELGRWTATDPILFAGGLNHYAYVGNDPVGYVDPSGMFRFEARTVLTILTLGPEIIEAIFFGAAIGARAREAKDIHRLRSAASRGCPEANAEYFRRAFVFAGTMSAGVRSGRGRSASFFRPHQDAAGPHTVFRRNPLSGRIEHYQTFDEAGVAGGNRRFRGTGSAHGGLEAPLVLVPRPGHPGGRPYRARVPEPWEYPAGF
jgi:RHS repeat-associated protein